MQGGAETMKENWGTRAGKAIRRNPKFFLGLLLSTALLIYYVTFVRQPESNTKTVTIEIRHSDGSTKTLKPNTTTEKLRELLDALELVSGKETEYGLILLTVDGIFADSSKGETWLVSRKDVPLISSIDTIPISNGDFYVITHIVA